jgi:hypothetical protein
MYTQSQAEHESARQQDGCIVSHCTWWPRSCITWFAQSGRLLTLSVLSVFNLSSRTSAPLYRSSTGCDKLGEGWRLRRFRTEDFLKNLHFSSRSIRSECVSFRPHSSSFPPPSPQIGCSCILTTLVTLGVYNRFLHIHITNWPNPSAHSFATPELALFYLATLG